MINNIIIIHRNGKIDLWGYMIGCVCLSYQKLQVKCMLYNMFPLYEIYGKISEYNRVNQCVRCCCLCNVQLS